LHKKRIGGKDYFYTSVRDDKGRVKTIYLGSNKKNAVRKEKKLGLNSLNNNFNLHFVGITILVLILSFSGFFLFTGLSTINVTDIVEEDESLSSLGEENISIGSLEDTQSITPDNKIFSSPFENTSNNILSNDSDVINDTVYFNQTFELNNTKGNMSGANIYLNNTIELGNKSLDNFSSNITQILSMDSNVSDSEIIISNESLILNEDINFSVQTLQYDAVIYQPVKWKKKVLLSSSSDNISVSIPKDATNISVVEILNGTEVEINLSDIYLEGKNESLSSLITGNVVSDARLSEDIINKIYYFLLNIFSFTGYAVVEVDEDSLDEELNLIIEEEVEEFEIEYQTPGPNATEINISDYTKQIIVFSDIHYENILAFTEIKDAPLSSVNLYWMINGSRNKIDFLAYDNNDNELVDYIEWIVPHLSNQTYELEINILNIQSYPTVGKNWTVAFNTTGVANLTISGFNGTVITNESEDSSLYDLKVLDLMCGETNIAFSWINSSLFVEDYNCSTTSKETSKVLTTGKHTLEFSFGNQRSYAYNHASNCTAINSAGFHNLTANVTGYNSTPYCMLINSSDVVFDCNGYIIDGEDTPHYNITGIFVNATSQLSNITIQNCKIYDFSWDIYLKNVTNTKLINNTISSRNTINNSFKGITLESSSNVSVENNTLSLVGSSTISPAPLSGAIVFTGTSDSNITNNVIYDIEGDGIFLTKGASGSPCQRNNIVDNTINNTLSDSNEIYGALRLNECFNNTLSSNDIISEEECGPNCNKVGIYLSSSDQNNLTNNYVYNSSKDNIYLTGSEYNILLDNVLNYTVTNDGEGLEIVGGSNENQIINNSIYLSSGAGLFIGSESNRNKFSGNIFANNSFDGVEVYNSFNNTFKNSNISNNQWSGIYFENSSDNWFFDGFLIDNNIAGGTGEVGVSGIGGGAHNLLNMTFNQSDINFTSDTSGRLNVKWYFDVFVNNSIGNVGNANLTTYDNSNDEVFSSLTSITGNIVQKNLTEYSQNFSGKNYYTKYNLTTFKSSYATDVRYINFTTNYKENITLNGLPNVTVPGILPKVAYVGNSLNCSSIPDDAEQTNLNISFTWFKNEIANTTFDYSAETTNSTRVYTGNLVSGIQKYESWICSARSHDGTIWGPWVNSSSINISNSAPTLSSVNITSSDILNRSNGSLSGGFSFSDVDGDTMVLNETKWWKFNGSMLRPVEQTNLINLTTIGSSDTAKGDSWTFSFRGYDGASWTDWTNSSSNLTISNSIPIFDKGLTDQTAALNNEFIYDINCTDNDGDSITYFDNTTLFNIDTTTGLINDTPTSGEEGSTYSITITCKESISSNITSTFDYIINSEVSEEEEEVVVEDSGSSGSKVWTECASDKHCDEGFICFESICVLQAQCDIDEDCNLDEKCIGGQCSKIFDLRVLDVKNPAVFLGDQIYFTYYIKAMSNIANDVNIEFWIEDDEEIKLSSDIPGVCGDGYITSDEECDLGSRNNDEGCAATYGYSCGYCTSQCKLENMRGNYCGDNECDQQEDKFICPEDCGHPTKISEFFNDLKNIFKFTGFTVVGKINSEVVYVGNVGDEITNEASLYVPSEVLPGVYELHLRLTYQGSEVEAVKTIEILESTIQEEYTLSPDSQELSKEDEQNMYPLIYLLVLIISIIVLMYLIIKAYLEIKKLSKRISNLRVKSPLNKQKLSRKLSKKQKLRDKIVKWKKKGYDTRILESKLKEQLKSKDRKDLKIKYFKDKVKIWEQKGYDTTILRHKLGNRSKVIRISKSRKKLSKNIQLFENKIAEWKKKGYDTAILEKRLKLLKRKD